LTVSTDHVVPDVSTGVEALFAVLGGGVLPPGMAVPARLYRLLAASDDPVWREIGQQLRDGRMSLRQVVQVEQYRRHLHRGLAEHGHRFGEAVTAARSYLEPRSG
jgi:hypothetical protein